MKGQGILIRLKDFFEKHGTIIEWAIFGYLCYMVLAVVLWYFLDNSLLLPLGYWLQFVAMALALGRVLFAFPPTLHMHCLAAYMSLGIITVFFFKRILYGEWSSLYYLLPGFSNFLILIILYGICAVLFLLKLFHIKSFAVQVIPETAVSAEKPVTSALEKHADGFCSNCGAPMGSDDLVCGQCGQKKATVASPDPASPKKDD